MKDLAEQVRLLTEANIAQLSHLKRLEGKMNPSLASITDKGDEDVTPSEPSSGSGQTNSNISSTLSHDGNDNMIAKSGLTDQSPGEVLWKNYNNRMITVEPKSYLLMIIRARHQPSPLTSQQQT